MLTIKNLIPSFAPLLLIASGVVCFLFCIPYIESLLDYIRELSSRVDDANKYVGVTTKIVVVASFCEFSSQICADAGENYLSSKIEFAGKIFIVSLCAPEFLKLISVVIDMIDSI